MVILIVDDSKSMRILIMHVLRRAGFGKHTFLEASNAQEAVDCVRSSSPSLMLCDWNLRGMTGLDVVQEIRGAGLSVRFGIVTSEVDARIHEAAYGAGALFVVAKPFTPEAFQRALAPLM